MSDDRLEKLQKRTKLRSQLSLVFMLIGFLYLTIGTSEAIWQNYQINQEITKLKVDIAKLEEQKQELKNLILYLNTESFKDREARRKLGYRKVGENVLAFPNPIINNPITGQPTDSNTITKKNLSNPQKWWDYIFG